MDIRNGMTGTSRPLNFHVDEFQSETGDQSEWFLSGWAFAGGTTLRYAVPKIGGKPVGKVSYGWDRPDVLAAFPSDCPSPHVGFQGCLLLDTLDPGNHILQVVFFSDQDQAIGHLQLELPLASPLVPRSAPSPQPETHAGHPCAPYLDQLESTLLDLPCADATETWARREGRDWPGSAPTMIGWSRLRHLRACAETVLREGIPGDFIETGVWRGGACIMLRGVLKAFDVTDRTVWLADTFGGLPKPNPECYPADAESNLHRYQELAIPLDQVRENFRRCGLLDGQVRFLEGLFSETLPSTSTGSLALLRLDGDMYESTMDALTWLYPKLSPGGFCIIDDYGAIPACRQAVRDYRNSHGIRDAISLIDWTGAWWRKSARLPERPNGRANASLAEP